MSFKKGFALGDAYGPEMFLEGAEMRDALKEAEAFYPKHTPVHFDGDLRTLASQEGDEFSANADPARMPAVAHKMSGLGAYSGDDVLRMSVEDAHRILLPFFQVKIQAGQHKGKIVKAYDTAGTMRANFLTENAKLGKAVKGVRSLGVKPGLSRGPNLLPHRLALDLSKKHLPMSGLGFCVGSNEACRSTCLVYTGNNPVADSQVPVKLARSEALVKEPVAWLRMFISAIEWHVAYCRERRLKPYVRPNVLSDIPWEFVFPDLFDIFPKTQHYDYTKVAGRHEGATNYDLTFSFSGTNDRLVEHELGRKHRIAVVFWLEKPCARYKKSKICDKPSDLTFLGQKVIDGDTHDFRPLDPPGSIIGLSYKIPMVAGRRIPKPTGHAAKFVVETFRDADTGALLVAGTPAQLGASEVFEHAGPTEVELA